MLFQERLKYRDLIEQPEIYLQRCQRSVVGIFRKTS